MAFAARLGPLTEELVEALLETSGKSHDTNTIKTVRDATLHKLKSHTLLRTNQFEVQNILDGLEERFRVNCRDSLADALRQRLDALQNTPSKWHPDILHFLLELSDQPVQKSRLSDLEALRPAHEDTEIVLRWEDIAKEDGWANDPDLWSSIQYSDGSDDEVYLEDASNESEPTSEIEDGNNSETTLESLVSHPQDTRLLDTVKEAQAWREAAPASGASGHSRKTLIPEIQAIREVLFMLQGLPTTMFDTNGHAVPKFQISHLMWDTHEALINSFTEYGRQLGIIRRLANAANCPAHMQAFQDCLCSRLRAFDLEVNTIEARLAQVESQVTTSLMAVKGELDILLEPLTALANVVSQVKHDSKSEPFHFLEVLFDEATMAQLSGQTAVFEFLTRIFLDCFNSFLRPVRLWMDEGRLIPGDVMFFVSESADEVPPSQVWQNRFSLRRDADDTLHTPHFLRPSAKKIFIAGKNIVVLRQLGKHEALRDNQVNSEPILSYETVCPTGSDMAPFPDLFDAAFERWIQSKYRKTSQILKDTLFQSCQLASALDALQHIYLMSDGSAASYFCDHLFSSIDGLRQSWHDRYTLTVIAQEAFVDNIESSRLTMSVRDDGHRSSSLAIRDSVKTGLPNVTPAYRLSWPIQMILTSDSILRYQEIFTFLLQIKRALYALHKMRVLDRYRISEENQQEDALFYSLRNSLLWFTCTLQTYLSTLVLAPNINKMRSDMGTADDVDAMMSIHDAALKQIKDDALLGNRLKPIQECVLDILDLGVKLEQVYAKAASISRDNGEDSGTDMDDESTELEAEKAPERPLLGLKSDFDKHLRFICEGLRSVARASSNSQSSKWDMLADMLQTGIRENRW